MSAGRIASGTRRKQSGLGFHSQPHTFLSALAAADRWAEVRRRLSGPADFKSRSGSKHPET